MKISGKAYSALGQGLYESPHIKRLIIQNSNLLDGNLHHLVDGIEHGLKDVKSLEFIDFQCNELNDSVYHEIGEIITE